VTAGQIVAGTGEEGTPAPDRPLSRLGRRRPSSFSLPTFKAAHLMGGLLAALAVWVLVSNSAVWMTEMEVILVYAIAALGQDWLIGRTGQVSVGVSAFLAVGAFTTARVAEQSWGQFPVALIASGVGGGLLGLLVGSIGLRFRGLYLILGTLALQFIVSFAAQEYQGHQASLLVPTARLGSVHMPADSRSFGVAELIILALVLLLLWGMYSRSPGRTWQAIRTDQLAAAVTGIEVTRWKLTAFVGSSVLTSIAGCLLAYQTQVVGYETFSLGLAITVVVMVFIGGQATLLGSLIGATLVMLLPFELQRIGNNAENSFPSLSNWLSKNVGSLDQAVYGALLLAVLVFEPRGVVGVGRRIISATTSLYHRISERGAIDSGSVEAGAKA
jgi:branched-chain amino acid transport system permease protein